MTPLLVLLFGFHASTAVGTDLLFASVTKTVGTTIHNAGKTVDWQIVGRLATGSVPATILTLLVINHFGVASKGVATVISLTLGTALLISAISLLVKDKVIAIATARNPDFGAGALGTIALFFLYPRIPIVRIVGSDIAHAVPLTLVAGLGHWYLGSVNFHLLESLLVGSIPGIILGSYGARYAPEWVLKPSLGVVLTLVGIKMLTA
jgi:uncharacterized membrane protein YfcA